MDRYDVIRTDDNGHSFSVKEDLPKDEAEKLCAALTARGHKQLYQVLKVRCSRCNGDPSEHYHQCPYQAEINNDSIYECCCCDVCHQECSDLI